jgi:hypothetical protein
MDIPLTTVCGVGATHYCSAITEGEETLKCRGVWACTLIEGGSCDGAVCLECR